MKKPIILLLIGWVSSSLAYAQEDENTVVRVVPPSIGPGATAPDQDDAPPPPRANPGGGAQVVANPNDAPPANPPAGKPPVADDAVVVDGAPISEDDGGFLIKDANINDIFQLLAKRAGKQYFHNNLLNTDDHKVTGHLNGDTSPLKQMEELAFHYGLRMYVKGNTVYAMTGEQLGKLPAKEWTYSLKYLRPTDIEQIKALIMPMLTAGRGIVNFEPKTNTIVVIDTLHHIEMVESLLKKIDKPKGQIVVEVKILRINSKVGKHQGVDWSSSLGASGVPIDIIRSLSSVFGLKSDFIATAGTSSANAASSEDTTGTSNIILTPFQLSGVLRALNEGNFVSQQSNPVVITEDNEKASISLIDRVPIITSSVTTGTGPTTVTDEVRYTIDKGDSTDPDKTREIGVTITMTPSLLPDGTIRMSMRPRSAQIVEYVKGATQNLYPRVSEATIESIARIPDGNSLVVGGFFSELKSNKKSKVPLLGDVPIIRFFFKSKQITKEQSSLVFVVTPTSYNPACVRSHRKTSAGIRRAASLKPKASSVDSSNPGAAHEPNLRRTLRGMRPTSAPYYPKR